MGFLLSGENRYSDLLRLLGSAAVVTALRSCPALRLEVLLRRDREGEGALTADAAELNRLGLIVLLHLEARRTALARLHALCQEELLLLLGEEELLRAVAAGDVATRGRRRHVLCLWLVALDLHLLVQLLLLQLLLVHLGSCCCNNSLLRVSALSIELVEARLDGRVIGALLELLLQSGDKLLNSEGRHLASYLG